MTELRRQLGTSVAVARQMFELIDDLSPFRLANFEIHNEPDGAHVTRRLYPDGTFKHGAVRNVNNETIPIKFTPEDEWWNILTH